MVDIVGIVHIVFIKGHSWPEYLFLYLLALIVLRLNYERKSHIWEWERGSTIWDLPENFLPDKSDSILLAAFQPILALLALAVIVFGWWICVYFAAFLAKAIFYYLPDIVPNFKIGEMNVSGESFQRPEFSVKKMALEGSILGLLIYFFSYAGVRHKELKDVNKD